MKHEFNEVCSYTQISVSKQEVGSLVTQTSTKMSMNSPVHIIILLAIIIMPGQKMYTMHTIIIY